MKIAIIGAMEEEIADLLKESKDIVKIKENNLENYNVELYGKNCILAYSGIGMVSSAVMTTYIINKYNPDFLIFTGVAGALNEKLKPTDIVIGEELFEYLFDATAFGYEIGQIPRLNEYIFKSNNEIVNYVRNIELDLNIYTGKIISGDKFISNIEEKKKLGEKYNSLACDMESASFSQVCYMMNKKFLVIRSISDSLTDDSVMEYNEFVEKAVKNNKKIIKNILENYEW